MNEIQKNIEVIEKMRIEIEKFEEVLRKDSVAVELGNATHTESINNIIADKKKETFDEIIKKLSTRFMFGNVYIFLDIDLAKYTVINYVSNDKFETIKSYDKTTITHIIISMIETRIDDGEIEFFPLSKETISKITNSIKGVKKSFDRTKPEFFKDTDYLPTLNLFKQTILQEYQPIEKIGYGALSELLATKYKRFNLLLKNNIGDDECVKWFLNWVAMEINQPQDIKTTFVIIGEQGSGKSLLVEEIFKENIYHFSNVSIVDNKTLSDKFNDIYSYKSFMIMNEVSTMDLKENNQIAQELKRLITDGSYINRGIYKSGVEKKKAFNIAFTTNKNEPLQIENGDRRFSVFGRGQKLLEMPELKKLNKEFNEDFEGFIDNVKLEIKEFLFLVKSLDYDKSVSLVPIMTELKKKIISKTNTKEDLMKSFFNTKNYAGMETLLKQFEFDNEERFYIKVKKMFEIGIFTNEILFQIFTAIFEVQITDFNKLDQEKKAGAFWGKILHKPAKAQVKINGEVINIKTFNEDDIEFKKERLRELLTNLKNGVPIVYETKPKDPENIDDINEDEIPF
jgi:ABC-type dipeptide/oligopeptide/nickel transport system ATPase component